MFSGQNQHSIKDNLAIIKINSTTTIKLTDIPKITAVQSHFPQLQIINLSTVFIFHTEQDSYVLSELQSDNDGQKQINAAVGGRLTSISSDQTFKNAMLNAIKAKMGFTAEIANRTSNTRSTKIIKKLFTILENDTYWGKRICINNLGQVTAVKHITCKHKDLNKIVLAINEISQSEYIFLSLDKIIDIAIATSTNSGIDKQKLTIGILEIDATGISNDVTVAALAEQGALYKLNPAKEKPKKISIIEHRTTTVPTDILAAIFILIDDRSVFAFLLTSKTLSTLLNEKNELWKRIMQPRMDAEIYKFIKDKDYLTIWRKRTFLNIDFSHMTNIEIKKTIEMNSSPDNLILSALFNQKIPTALTIELKEINAKKIHNLIRQDDGIALFHEASRMSTMLDDILKHDIEQANQKTGALKHDHYQGIYDVDFYFIPYLMPYILDTHANKCFKLFIQTFYFGHELLARYYDNTSIKEVAFPQLKNHIFNSNNSYFISKFIELTLAYAADHFFLKDITKTCAEKNAVDLLIQTLTKPDIAPEKYSWLLEDEDASEIIQNRQSNYTKHST